MVAMEKGTLESVTEVEDGILALHPIVSTSLFGEGAPAEGAVLKAFGGTNLLNAVSSTPNFRVGHFDQSSFTPSHGCQGWKHAMPENINK